MTVKTNFIGCQTICQVFLNLRPKNKPHKTEIKRCEYAMRRFFHMLLPHVFDLHTSGSAKSLSFMQRLGIFFSIIWFVVIFTKFYLIALQNKMFEGWIATIAL